MDNNSDASEFLDASVNENIVTVKQVEKSNDSALTASANTYTDCVDTQVKKTFTTEETSSLKKGGSLNVRCNLCSCEVSSNSVLDSHINGSRHKKKIKALQIIKNLKELGEKGISVSSVDSQDVYDCEICSIRMNSAQQLEVHLGGAKHKNKVAKGKIPQENKPVSSPKSRVKPFCNEDSPPEKKKKEENKKSFFCKICTVLLNSEIQYEQHLLSKKHKNKTERTTQNKRCIKRSFQYNYHQGNQVANQWQSSKKQDKINFNKNNFSKCDDHNTLARFFPKYSFKSRTFSSFLRAGKEGEKKNSHFYHSKNFANIINYHRNYYE